MAVEDNVDPKTGLTWVRKWILKQMEILLPNANYEIRSDNNANLFTEWTGETQNGLENQWIREDTQRAINYMANNLGYAPDISTMAFKKFSASSLQKAKDIVEFRKKEYEEATKISNGMLPFNYKSFIKPVGTTTTCNLFLGKLITKTRLAGKLPPKVVIRSFDLPVEGGKAWNFFPGAGKSPKPGDFYELGKRVGRDGTKYEFKHVGVLLKIDGSSWETADSGQGGPSSGFDKIKRGYRNSTNGVLGWIDVDEYFIGWDGPKYYED